MLNFLQMLQGGAMSKAPEKASGTDRFFQALGSQKMGTNGGTWDRGIGMKFADAGMQQQQAPQLPMNNMQLGQQPRSQIVNPILQMLLQQQGVK